MTKKAKNTQRDRLQEISDRYGVMIYISDPDRKGVRHIVGVGWVLHGINCDKVKRAVHEAAATCCL